MKTILVFLVLSYTSLLAQVSGAQGAIAGSRQNLPTQQVSFPLQGGPGGLDPNLAFLILDNELVGGVPHLLLKAPSGPFSFSTVTDLSAIAGGGVNGSGTTNTLALWTSSSTIGNSLFSQTGAGVSAVANIASPNFNFTQTDAFGDNRITCTAASNCHDLIVQAPTTGGQPGAYVKVFTFATNGGILALGTGGAAVNGLELDIVNNGTISYLSYPQSTFANLTAGAVNPGGMVYCNDCAVGTHPCSTSGGTGSGTFAFRIGGPSWWCL